MLSIVLLFVTVVCILYIIDLRFTLSSIEFDVDLSGDFIDDLMSDVSNLNVSIEDLEDKVKHINLKYEEISLAHASAIIELEKRNENKRR